MIRNYLKIALRHLRKNLANSVINLAGLAAGMACCLLISLYVRHELSYDKFHQKAERIFRVKCTLNLNGARYHEAAIPFPAAEAFRQDFPEVEQAVRLYRNVEFPLVEVGERKFTEEHFLFADPAIFEVFDFPLLKGDPKTALNEPNSVVITEEIGRKYFGEADPIGQILQYENKHSLVVTAVARNVPANSHFKFDLLAPLEIQFGELDRRTDLDAPHKKWFWTGAWTYLLLSDRHATTSVSTKLPDFVKKYYPDRIKSGVELALQPATVIHLHSRLDNEIEPNSHALYVYIFIAIAGLILLIAVINFVNLSTARSTQRAKEVGVRKVIGANRKQLLGQLMGEAMIASALSMVLAIMIVKVSLPSFNQLTAQDLDLGFLESWTGLTSIVGLVFVVGLLSGLYPAFFLAGFQPTGILQKTISPRSGNERLRKALVVAQFAISTALIIGLGIIYQQMHFLRAKELGFEQNQVLIVKARQEMNNKFAAFRDELRRNPGILGVAGVSNFPGEGANAYRFVPEGGSTDQPAMLPLLFTGYDFLETMGIDIKQGRGFSRSSPSDQTEAFLLNEKAAADLGWQNNAIGKKLALFAPGTNDIWKAGSIIGVIENYHFESLHHEVKPLVLSFYTGHSYYAVKLAPGNPAEKLAFIESTWKTFSTKWPIEYFFLDGKLELLYQSEQKLAQVANGFAIIAIILACLGLFGLSTFAAEKRTKEVGIRKVMGASVASLAFLLSTDFLKLVLLANLAAWPIAWYVMSKWLQDFAYRVNIAWWVFVLASGVTLFIALLTVSAQAIRAALANPVDSIRYE